MRQGNGTDLLGVNDPRNPGIGIIYVAPNDARQSVLDAILTQEKLARKQIVVVLPAQNKAFQHSVDFNALKNMRRKLQSQIIFVIPGGSSSAEFARQRRFDVFSSLERCARSLRQPGHPQKRRHLPWRQAEIVTPASSANPTRSRQTRPLPPVVSLSQSEEELPPQPASQQPVGGEHGAARKYVAANEAFIYLAPDEDLVSVRERLRQTSARHITLVTSSKIQLRSHISWRLLYSFAREQGKDVLVISSDRQVRSVAKAVGFRVADSLDSLALSRTQPRSRLFRARSGRVTPPRPARVSRENATSTRIEAVPTQPAPGLPDIDAPFPYNENIEPGPPNRLIRPRMDDPFDDSLDDLNEDYSKAQEIRRLANQDRHAASNDKMSPHYNIEDLGDDVILPPPPSQPSLENEDTLLEDIPLPDSAGETPVIQLPTRPLIGKRSPAMAAGRVGAAPPAQRPPAGMGAPPVVSRRARTTPPPGRATVARPGRAKPPPKYRPLWITLAALLLVLLVFGGVILAAPEVLVNLGLIQPPPATVTITPASSIQQKMYAINAVTAPPIASQHQVQARFLSYTTSSQTETAKATGLGQRPAIAARGNLTLYNAMHYAQTIAAGTVFTDTNGIQVVNDKVAIIPAARPPTEGFVTVLAHTLGAGASGNIPAFDFNGVLCCAPGITVQNKAAFSGGQDRQDYTFVQQSDIDGEVNPLKALLVQNGQATLKAQIHPNEQSVGPAQCLPNITSDHTASDKATSVTVTVTETCTSEVYDRQGALDIAGNLLKTDASQSLGAGYSLVSKVITALTRAQVTGSAKVVTLLVTAKGLWAYQFSNTQRQNLVRLITGKSELDAQSLLRQMGVARTDVQLAWPGGNMLPDKSDEITIVVQNVPG